MPAHLRGKVGVEFVITRAADGRYRSHIYCPIARQKGSGRDFDGLAECVTTTLRLRAKHEGNRAYAASAKTGAHFGNC